MVSGAAVADDDAAPARPMLRNTAGQERDELRATSDMFGSMSRRTTWPVSAGRAARRAWIRAGATQGRWRACSGYRTRRA